MTQHPSPRPGTPSLQTRHVDILPQRTRYEVQEPWSDHAIAAPDFGNLREITLAPVILRMVRIPLNRMGGEIQSKRRPTLSATPIPSKIQVLSPVASITSRCVTTEPATFQNL